MTHRDSWSGAGMRAPDTSGLQRPNRIGEQHLSVGTLPNPHIANSDAAMMKYMKDERFFPYFGLANKMMPPSYMRMDEENYVLPEAYVGNNVYLRDFIIDHVTNEAMWGTLICLPWRKFEGGMVIAWDKWIFNDTLATRTPEEAVSRLLTSNFTSDKASMHRLGVALILEHGFMKTEKGRQHYAMQLVQMKNAIARSAQYGVPLALLDPKGYVDDNAKYRVRDTHNSLTTINNWFQDEIDEFACFNKSEDGFTMALQRMDTKLFQRNQKVGNVLIMPHKSGQYLKHRPEQKYFFISGVAHNTLNAINIKEKLHVDGRVVIESYPHVMGEHMASQDPLYKEVTIGGFFHMLDKHLRMVPLDKYRTAMLDTLIYSEDKDDFYPLPYRLMIRYMGMYDGWTQDDGSPPSKYGDMPIRDLGKEMFAPSESTVDSWGLLYEQQGRLDNYVKMLETKDQSIYDEFISKFILPFTEEKEEEEKKEQHNEDQAEQGAQVDLHSVDLSVNLFLEKELPLLLFPDTLHGFRHRLTVLLRFLKTLDNTSSRRGFSTNLFAQVTKHLQSHPVNADVRKGQQVHQASALIYSAAWELTRELLLLYDMEVATRAQTSLTPLESYVAKESRTKSWSGLLTDSHATLLSELNEKSPYWKPAGNHSLVTQVTLIAPEPFAADPHTVVKRLPYSSLALTLASSHLVLFGTHPKEVQRMIDSQVAGEGISMHWKNTTPGLIERAGRLQFSIVLSAMFSLLQPKLSFKNLAEQLKHYKEVAAAWLKLAKPEHMLTGDRETFQQAIKESQLMPTLQFQSGIDTLIYSLRDALNVLYQQNLTESPDVDAAVKQVSKCYLVASNISEQHHTRSAAHNYTEEQSNTAAAAGDSLGVFNRSYLGTTLPEFFQDHDPSRQQVDLHEAENVVKNIRQKVQQLRKTTPTAGALSNYAPFAPSGPLPAGSLDSTSYLPTYVRFIREMSNDAFDAFFQRNEAYTSYLQDEKKFADGIKAMADKLQSSEDMDVLKFLTSVHRANISSDLLRSAKAALKDTVKITGQKMSLEICSLIRAEPNAFHDFVTAAGQEASRFVRIDVAVALSISLHHLDMQSIGDAIAKHMPSVAASQHNRSSFPSFVFLDSNKGSAATASEQSNEASLITTYNINERKFLDRNVIKGVLKKYVKLSDGYFWYWNTENDMLQVIGGLGFRPSKRYRAGTMIQMSGFGETGYTFYGHVDMMISDNAAIKQHYGHLTYNAASVVMNPRFIIHARNCFVDDYLGGNGHRVWDASSEDDHEDYMAGGLQKDIFIVPVPMSYEVEANHMDITGRYHPDIGASEEAHKATWYPSSNIYSRHWGWRPLWKLSDNTWKASRRPRDNTTVFQEHQQLYNHGSGKFDLVVIDKGHWGDRVYPGCGRARRALETHLKPVKYDNTNTIGITM